jgi:hypothetical protein
MYIYYLSRRRPSTLCYRIVHVTSIFYFRLCIFTIWVREGRPPSVTGLYTWLQSSILGYVYLLFESEKAVRALLQDCTHDFSSGDYYYKISSRRMRAKEVCYILHEMMINFLNVQCYSLRANPLARSLGQGKLDSDKWKLWKNLLQ